MSLENTPEVLTYRLGLLCSSDFDSRDLLDETLGPKLDSIAHLYTNGVNALLLDWCRANGLTHTVVPVSGGRGLPASTRDIVEACDVVLLIATPGSKSAGQVERICGERAARDPAFKWRRQDCEPIALWREKVGRVAEIVEAVPKGEQTDALKAIAEVVA